MQAGVQLGQAVPASGVLQVCACVCVCVPASGVLKVCACVCECVCARVCVYVACASVPIARSKAQTDHLYETLFTLLPTTTSPLQEMARVDE
jgi:hypothetical protein